MSEIETIKLNELFARAKAGDREALGMLLEHYRPLLVILARTKVWRRVQARVGPGDLVQETITIALTKFDQFRGTTVAEFAAWLKSILHNVGCNVLRRPDLEKQFAAEMDASSDSLAGLIPVDNHTTPSQHARRNEGAVEVARALADLPEHYRQVIELKIFDGLTHEEIAEQLGSTVHSVKNIYLRALQQLGGKLEKLR